MLLYDIAILQHALLIIKSSSPFQTIFPQYFFIFFFIFVNLIFINRLTYSLFVLFHVVLFPLFSLLITYYLFELLLLNIFHKNYVVQMFIVLII